jgi:hypothetical protein
VLEDDRERALVARSLVMGAWQQLEFFQKRHDRLPNSGVWRKEQPITT